MARRIHDGSAGALSGYLRQLERFPLLSAVEERQLGGLWQRCRDVAAARRMVTANLRFVVKIALEYRSYGVRLLDLIQEGNLGLIIAVKRFDPQRGVRFTTYAVWWIRAYIQEHIRRSWSLVRFGTTRAEQRCFYRLRRERHRLERNGQPVEVPELARALGVRPQELEAIEARITRRDLSLDEPVFSDTEETRGDRIADERRGPESEVAERELVEHARIGISRALGALDAREQLIIRQRFLNGRAATLKELGDFLGISRERVRQLEARAMAKMRLRLGGPL